MNNTKITLTGTCVFTVFRALGQKETVVDRALQYDSHWSLLSGYNPLQQTEWKACACAAVGVLVQVVSC